MSFSRFSRKTAVTSRILGVGRRLQSMVAPNSQDPGFGYFELSLVIRDTFDAFARRFTGSEY